MEGSTKKSGGGFGSWLGSMFGSSKKKKGGDGSGKKWSWPNFWSQTDQLGDEDNGVSDDNSYDGSIRESDGSERKVPSGVLASGYDSDQASGRTWTAIATG